MREVWLGFGLERRGLWGSLLRGKGDQVGGWMDEVRIYTYGLMMIFWIQVSGTSKR